MKKLMSLLLAAAITLTASVSGYAESTVSKDVPRLEADLAEKSVPFGDLEEIDAVALDEEAFAEAESIAEEQQDLIKNADTVDSASVFDQYEFHTEYFYNQLTTTEKSLWNDMQEHCEALITSTATLTDIKFATIYFSASAISNDRLDEIFVAFKYSCPRYYFLYYGYTFNTAGGKIVLKTYDEFLTYAQRTKAEAAVAAETQRYLAAANKQTDDMMKMKVIADMLCEDITYEKVGLHQSLYGALVADKCVCAGYTQAMTYFAAALGFDNVPNKIAGHVWNKIKIGGKWYENDVTWMDHTEDAGYINYAYFMNSYQGFLDISENSREGHEADAETFPGFTLPACVTVLSKPCGDITGFEISSANNAITLKWDSMLWCGGVNVYRCHIDEPTLYKIACTRDSYYLDNDPDLINGESYVYILIPFTPTGWGSQSNAVNATVTSAVPVPTGVRSSAASASVKVAWNAVPGAISYRLRRNSGSGWETVATTSATSYTERGLTNAVTYTYAVHAYVGGTWSGASATVTATPHSATTMVPKNPTITAAGSSTLIKWTAVKGATSYRVRRNDGTGWVTAATVNTNSYKDTGLKNGTTYTYGVMAYVNGMWSNASALVSATPHSANTMIPKNPTISAASGTTLVKWTAVNGATSYRVRRNDGTGWKTVANVTTNSYKDTGLTNNTTYTYGVMAYVNGTWSAASALVSATPHSATTMVPKNPTISAAGSSTLVKWTAVKGATSYRIRRNDGTGWVTVTDVKTTSYKDTGLKNGTTYTYGVMAYVNGTWSAASALVSATPHSANTMIPKNPTATAGDAKVTLKWTAVNGATSYRVRRNDGSGWETIANVKTNSYADSGLTNGKTYTYGVMAYVNGTWSAASALVKATPKSPYSAVPPTGINIMAGNKKIALAWRTVNGATAYRIRRSDGSGWETLATLNATSYNDTDVVNGTGYVYGVLACVNGKWSDASTLVSAVPAAAKSGVTASVTAAVTPSEVTIKWSSVSGATKYRVRRHNGSEWETIATTSSLSCTDSIFKDASCKYVVYAYVNNAFGAASTTVSVVR